MTQLSDPLNACPIKCDRVHIDCQNAYSEYSEKKEIKHNEKVFLSSHLTNYCENLSADSNYVLLVTSA